MSRYIALAHRGGTGSWGISFPDFPGCISAADSFEELVERGAEALRFHVEGLLEDGETIAEPRSLEVLQADPEFAADFDKAIVTVVPLLPPRDRPMRVNVILDANLLARIDNTAQRLGLNRSEFLAEGARRLILSPEKAKSPQGGGEYTVRSVYEVERVPFRHIGAAKGVREIEATMGEPVAGRAPMPPSNRPPGIRAGQRVMPGLTKGTKKKR